MRAVDLAKKTFTMAELGCGWGCWMNNTGVAARRRGLRPYLIGVEGDKGHVAFAREACATNGFGEDEVRLYHGIAAATAGTALFPRQTTSGVEWGLEPVFHATEQERKRAIKAGTHEELPMISLDEVIGDRKKLDLLHVDIQGGEADLVNSCWTSCHARSLPCDRHTRGRSRAHHRNAGEGRWLLKWNVRRSSACRGTTRSPWLMA